MHLAMRNRVHAHGALPSLGLPPLLCPRGGQHATLVPSPAAAADLHLRARALLVRVHCPIGLRP